jgi:prepilin-type N-terminal cleavage/methylation domain-containing protein
MQTARSSRHARSGFTLIEIVLVLTILSAIMALGLPRLQIGATRADAAAQQVRSVFQTAQRTSLTRQYDVIVSVDTLKGGLRIAEDVNNNGAIEVSEWKFWRPLGENDRFRVPPIGLNNTTPTKSVVGSQLTSVDQLPSVIFHRDGSASTDAEMYVASTWRGRVDYRVVSLTRSTGRAEILRLSGTGSSAAWGVNVR